MQLRSDQLEAHLAKSLAPVYLVQGDEPLLVLEAADAIRAAARKRGFEEREVLFVERSFDWSSFEHSTASLSLFGGRKIVELRLSSGKPGVQGSAALARYAGNPNPDTVLVVTMPRPEGPAWWKAPWFTGLSEAGAMVEAAPVARAALPQWIAARLARQRQRATPALLEFLADRVEGNLLAAQQEIQKLGLLAPEGELEADAIDEAVASVARFDPQLAAEALARGDLARYARILEGLKAEGESPVLVGGTIAGALLATAALAGGRPTQVTFRIYRIWAKPLQAALERAARRFSEPVLEKAIAKCARIDRLSKGIGRADPWDALLALGLELAHESNA